MIRIAIVDDENIICSNIERNIYEYCDAMQLKADIDIFNSGETILAHLHNNIQYHMIFLDIELVQCNGIDVAHEIRDIILDETTQIIFVSGKDGYDRQLFAFRPFAFIAKPFSSQQISFIIEKYLRIYGKQNELFHYKYGHDTFWVKRSDILYFKSDDRKVIIHKQDEQESFYATLEKIHSELKGQGFFSPHKSYLVNYRFIKAFHIDCIIMTNGDEIPVAKGKREEIAKIQIAFEKGSVT